MTQIFTLVLALLFCRSLSSQYRDLDREFEESKDFVAYQYKNLPRSLIDWENLDPDSYLDYEKWKLKMKRRERTPKWKVKLRDRKLIELMGRVLDCEGECRVYRGLGYAKAQFKSSIKEGDEVYTIGQSYAWIFLIDGTLIRVSPNSSITFKEINIGRSQNFIHIRVNSGNVLWLGRTEQKYVVRNRKETDTIFLPLEMLEANPPFKRIKIDENDLFSVIKESTSGREKYERLNALIRDNNKLTDRKASYAFIVMPNGSIFGKNLSIEISVLVDEVSYLKLRTPEQLHLMSSEDENFETKFFYRGFENKEEMNLEKGHWYEVGRKGRNISRVSGENGRDMGEFVTSNIPSILIGRELMVKKYSSVAFKKMPGKELAETYGYRQWGDIGETKRHDQGLRLTFLKEYTRRTETRYLLVSELFKKKKDLEGGDGIKEEKSYQSFYSRAMQDYLIYNESLDFTSSDREILNSTLKPYWRIIHGRR